MGYVTILKIETLKRVRVTVVINATEINFSSSNVFGEVEV